MSSTTQIHGFALSFAVTLTLAACTSGDGGADDDTSAYLDVVDAPSPDTPAEDAPDARDADDVMLDADDVMLDADDVMLDADGTEAFELEMWEGEVQPLDSFLCADAADDPIAVGDPVYIECQVEGADYRDDEPEPDDTIVVAAYNLLRGYRIDEQIDLLRSGEILPVPDVILASELDRSCDRSGDRNTAQELAEGLGMQYVYAVEFVELSGPDGEALCEHGNAIFSRYPLANVTPIRHRSNVSWYSPDTPGTGEPRLGGRIAIAADVVIGDRVLHVVSLHFESHPINGDVRDDQALELAELGLAQPHPVVIGGDMNAPLYWLDLQFDSETDPTVFQFLDRGYEDAHAPLPSDERSTADSGLVIDLIVGANGVEFSDPGICPGEVCDPLSDHRVVWATVSFGE